MAISRQSGGFESLVAPDFFGDSPPKKWRFWKAVAIRQFVAIFDEKMAIFAEKMAIFDSQRERKGKFLIFE